MPDHLLDIPQHVPSVADDLAESYVRAEITPNDPKLAFDLLIPKTWAVSSELGPVRHMLFHAAGLCFFTPVTEESGPVIAVTAAPCPFDIPIDRWALLSAAHEGWSVVASRWFPGSAGLFFELTATRMVDDVEYVRRTSVRIGQGSIVSVNSMCTRPQWDAVKEAFWTAHLTFALLQKDESSLEHWLRARVQRPAFSTVYPASWQAEPVPGQVGQSSGLHVRLVDASAQTLLAYLVVKAERNPFPKPLPLIELWHEARRTAQSAGVAMTSSPQQTTPGEDVRAAAVPGWLGGFVADARLGTADIAFRVGFVARSELIFSVSLCSPKLQDDTLVALRAERAFEIVRAGLELA
jgi:hypothetical protein